MGAQIAHRVMFVPKKCILCFISLFYLCHLGLFLIYLFLFGLGRALKLNALCCFIFACLGGWCPSSALFCALFISSEHLPWWQLAGGSEVDVP